MAPSRCAAWRSSKESRGASDPIAAQPSLSRQADAADGPLARYEAYGHDCWPDVEDFVAVLGLPANSSPVENLARDFGLVRSDRQLENRELGVAVALSDKEIVDAVFLFGNAKDNFLEYRGGLPRGLTFQARREEVRAAFGAPTASANANTREDAVIKHGGWDRYELESHVLHFSYALHTRFIELVTLMPAGHAG